MEGAELIEAWRAILNGPGKSWVLFENGTCVILREPEVDLAAQATALLREYGPVHAGSSFGDFSTIKVEDGSGWVVTCHHSDILTFVGIDEAGPDSQDVMVGLLGRFKRDQDAEQLRVLHVEEKMQAETDAGANFVNRFQGSAPRGGSLELCRSAGKGAQRMDGEVREYDYRHNWTMIVFCAMFFAPCAVVLGLKAANNDRGLVINGLIELGPGGATIFYWVLTALSVGFVVIAALLAYLRLTVQLRLAFGLESMTVPKSPWASEEQEIAYRDIIALSESTVSGQRFLYITHPGGKYTILASMLPSKAAFAEIYEFLAARVEEAQAAG